MQSKIISGFRQYWVSCKLFLIPIISHGQGHVTSELDAEKTVVLGRQLVFHHYSGILTTYYPPQFHNRIACHPECSV